VLPTTGYSEHARAGAGTNWEAGLRRARAMLDSARPGVPRLVVHITDGRPTRHLDPAGEVTEEGGLAQHVAEAALEADRLKTRGMHIYAVGIGRAPEYLPELQATSGPDVFDQSDSFDTFDAVNDDVILASDFESLEQLLHDVAGNLCGASLTITKEASTAAAPDQYAPAADFLGTDTVDRNPHHVTYVVNPGMDFRNVKTVADHAYWLSGLELRDATGQAPLGEVDALSRGFGVPDPEPPATRSGRSRMRSSPSSAPACSRRRGRAGSAYSRGSSR
jgi:hypothetical protein